MTEPFLIALETKTDIYSTLNNRLKDLQPYGTTPSNGPKVARLESIAAILLASTQLDSTQLNRIISPMYNLLNFQETKNGIRGGDNSGIIKGMIATYIEQNIETANSQLPLTLVLEYGFEDVVANTVLIKLVPRRTQLSWKRKDRPVFEYTRWERIRMVFEELGATFIKLAQVLSDRPDILPEPLIKEFQKLQSHVPPFDEYTSDHELTTNCILVRLAVVLQFYQYLDIPLTASPSTPPLLDPISNLSQPHATPPMTNPYLHRHTPI